MSQSTGFVSEEFHILRDIMRALRAGAVRSASRRTIRKRSYPGRLNLKLTAEEREQFKQLSAAYQQNFTAIR